MMSDGSMVQNTRLIAYEVESRVPRYTIPNDPRPISFSTVKICLSSANSIPPFLLYLIMAYKFYKLKWGVQERQQEYQKPSLLTCDF